MDWRERIRIVTGDIARMETEALVNAANNELWMGSGVAAALKQAGGVTIEQEAVRQGPISVGDSVLTGAGKLKSLYVIHAAAMAPGRPATRESVSAATRSALKLAAQHNIDSISFPALGTGVGGLSLAACATAMLTAAQQHCLKEEQPDEIQFVLFGENARTVFELTLQGLEG
jgi:O-acetyl-ADP-ribose deacetylase (regulator of RNase III)